MLWCLAVEVSGGEWQKGVLRNGPRWALCVMIKNFIFSKHISSSEVVRGTVYPTLLAARLQVQHPQVLVCLAVVSSRRARFENSPYVGSMCHDYKFYIFIFLKHF